MMICDFKYVVLYESCYTFIVEMTFVGVSYARAALNDKG